MECVKTGDNSLAFGYMNADTKKTAAEKLALKNTVQMLFLICCRCGNVSIPEEFTKSAIIQRKQALIPMMMITHVNEDSWQTLNRVEWNLVNWQTKTLLQSDDLTYFWQYSLPDVHQWASDLTYPLVKEKYDILVNHFKKEYILIWRR